MVKQLFSKLLLFAVVLLGSSLTIFAQSGTVTGVVTDALDGSSLPGATIVVKGTTTGTVTDIDGNYSLEVTPNQVLVFSYVGYSQQEHIVQPNTTLDVVMESSSQSLDGIVVIGYGTVKKKDATGSVTSISKDEFMKGAVTSPVNLIAGKVAGVQISSDGGAPGSSSQIRIRGGSSLNASNDPLIVIDGIPLSNEGGSGTRSALNNINPQDIETFTVLKDASATAIYGSRASNGVIIITTIKGKQGSPLKIEYQGKLSLSQKPKQLDILSSSNFQSLFDEKFSEHSDILGVWYDKDGLPVSASDTSRKDNIRYNTNWQEEIYKDAIGMDHALSVTGAWKTLPYRFSLGYTDQDGTLKTSNFKRTTLSASLNPTLLDDHLKLNVNANASFIKNTFANQGAIGAAVQMDPTKPVHNTDGKYGGYYAWPGSDGINPSTQATDNPVALLMQNDDKSNANRIFGNFQADYKFHFLPELRANLNLGLDQSKNDGTVYRPNFAAWTYGGNQGSGENNSYTSENKNELLDFYLNYTKDVASIQSHFELMAGYSWQHFYRENTWDNNNIPIFIDPVTGDSTGQELVNESGIDKSELYLVSFFGRLNYSFKERYLLTATVREDGTSRFSKDNRWGIFPSVALGWKINEESFLKDSKTVSLLKLRVGYGITGQQDIGGYYGYMGRYSWGNEFAMYPFGNNYYLTLRPDGYNPNLKWESTTTMNIGLDYGFLRDRLYGSIEYYQRKTDDLLSWVPEVAGANLTNYIDKNIGSLENTGVEIAVNGRIISNEKLYWELGINATYNKNEITELYEGANIETGGISGGVGNNIQVQSVGHPANSFYVYQQVYDDAGKPIEGLYVDRNGDGEFTPADKYIYKDPNADLYFGISSTFNYMDWSFYFSGRANFGNYVYNNVLSENAWYNRMYRNEGPYASNVMTEVTDLNFAVAQYHSDYFVQEASFFRMDDITLSYTFKDLLKNRVNLRLSATCNNAFVITNYTGLDPEAPNGIDNNFYPRSRIWTFGLNLQF